MRTHATFTTAVPLLLKTVSLYVAIGVCIIHTPISLPQPQIVTPVSPIVVRKAIASSPAVVTGEPYKVEVQRLGINLTIIPGVYDRTNDSWTLTDDKAQFATMTSLPNTASGSTFIYGHNTDAVFAKLAGLQSGDIATIVTSNGHRFDYIYNGQQIVQPSNTEVLSDKPANPRLTLMTCEGILSQTRRVMFFDLKSVA